MTELGCHGFQETETELLCYFVLRPVPSLKLLSVSDKVFGRQVDQTDWNEQQVERVRDGIKRLLRTISSNADIRLRTIEEENWNTKWEQSLRPIEVGKRIVIKPSWTEYENKNGRTVIQIDPKMSFGTGYHESTRLAVRLLENHVDAARPTERIPGSVGRSFGRGCSMLDVGTGTSILAIAAVKLGAERAVGIDNDSWSIENARENIQANQVASSVQITNTPLHKIAEKDFDIIAANITLNTIIELLPEMVLRLKRGGVLLLSGLLDQHEQRIGDELSRHGFTVVEKITENEWIAIATRRGDPWVAPTQGLT